MQSILPLHYVRMDKNKKWVHAHGSFVLDRPYVMGIVNITPDSFSDGSRLFADRGQAFVAKTLARCRILCSEGADILDIGGESTRPYATPISTDEEIFRVETVLKLIHDDPQLRRIPISIDTRHEKVARVALAAGVAIVNDISGLADPNMADMVARYRAGLVIGHLRSPPQQMQQNIRFEHLIVEIGEELAKKVEVAQKAGINREQIVVDPGIGFGKTAQQSAALVVSAAALQKRTGCLVLIGASRKSFLGQITGNPVQRRVHASVAAAVTAVEHGAQIVRVHDVKETVEAIHTQAAIHRAYAVWNREEDLP